MEATRKTPRLSLTLVFIALALAAALYALTAHSGPGKPHAASPQVALAAGTLSVGNSNDGQAIAGLSVGGLVPGGSGSQGSVTITNGGSLPGAFALSKSVTGGSALADLLHVVVSDGSTNIYDGSVGGMGTLDLGTFAPGASKTYTFTVNFPDGGTPSGNSSGDNAGRGVTATVDYVWSASADDGSSAAGGAGGTGAGIPGISGSGGPGGNGTVSSVLTLAGAGKQNPFKQKNAIVVKVTCLQAPCDIAAGGTLSIPGGGAKVYKFKQVKKHLSRAGRATIKLIVPKKAIKPLKKRLAKKKTASAKVKVTAKAGGKSSNAQRTIVLKK